MKSKLAIASMVMGLLSFVQLFGIEKAVVSIVFGSIALREILAGEELRGKNYAYAGIILGSLYILILAGFLIVKGPHIFELINRLK
ncbi:MAG: hypothetical protein A2252_09950 [Elusimicrobia bacterium RIFOXYA2_FULL_39_19]|nr:MAG: hypothetical protein A2252_09950 [Elusimicrobia bacterium RIFOXYA2_FULL_39_19]